MALQTDEPRVDADEQTGSYADDLAAAREAEGLPASGPTPGQQSIDGGEVPPADPTVDPQGMADLKLFDMGGKLPTTGTLTVRGKTVELPAGKGLRKGTRVRVEGVIVIDDVGDKDKRDKATGMVTDCVQRHSGYWEELDVAVAPEDA